MEGKRTKGREFDTRWVQGLCEGDDRIEPNQRPVHASIHDDLLSPASAALGATVAFPLRSLAPELRYDLARTLSA